ncbi:putative addiction module antidote protein [Rhizobium sp. rho-13.1]|uniref:Addiction module antidote protein n=1 Tax=Rhizobium rhododendri TaxID=2506430 RepID=A0ABY8IE93_9HYPH|nr:MULTISPECIES: addiction module antidote protein [Rhizobium]MBZ5758627.1 putative addiction module antidote protein [Rhizobium sp. VS19-DR96]MBZ5764543.1 putative addiction module antidote protein [Rhizobium sp. VS19-DR129.2]MBZ5772086.1 putative addiction module antidote protein [Rhizobium sp. VS19-DRK62.2]MBZ5783227.1 putative addiction module antidote protein [Rhizobium sp. VS19-DR121]MBZ5800675.1 putative addiction module antidote protein [Rhizobium sp. VS19-DR181]MBZ5816047.1 putative 
MPVKTLPFDAADHLQSGQSQLELLSDAFNSGSASYVAVALGVIARAKGMTEVSKTAGITREALYKALSADGDPKLSTLLGVLNALDIQLKLAPRNKKAPD